jgi:hypothetical protein
VILPIRPNPAADVLPDSSPTRVDSSFFLLRPLANGGVGEIYSFYAWI